VQVRLYGRSAATTGALTIEGRPYRLCGLQGPARRKARSCPFRSSGWRRPTAAHATHRVVSFAGPGDGLDGLQQISSPMGRHHRSGRMTGRVREWISSESCRSDRYAVPDTRPGRGIALKQQDLATSLCKSYGYKYSIIYLMRIRHSGASVPNVQNPCRSCWILALSLRMNLALAGLIALPFPGLHPRSEFYGARDRIVIWHWPTSLCDSSGRLLLRLRYCRYQPLFTLRSPAVLAAAKPPAGPDKVRQCPEPRSNWIQMSSARHRMPFRSAAAATKTCTAPNATPNGIITDTKSNSVSVAGTWNTEGVK
jgi:hypothetical protein